MNFATIQADIIEYSRKCTDFRCNDAADFFIPCMQTVFLFHMNSIEEIRFVGKHRVFVQNFCCLPAKLRACSLTSLFYNHYLSGFIDSTTCNPDKVHSAGYWGSVFIFSVPGKVVFSSFCISPIQVSNNVSV